MPPEIESRPTLYGSRAVEALYRLTTLIGEARELDQILRPGLEEVVRLFGAEAGVVRLLEPESGLLRLHAGVGLTPTLQAALAPAVRPGETPSGVAGRRRSVVVLDEKEPEATGSPWIAEGYRSFITAPMQHRKMLLGTLTLASRDPGQYEDADRELFTVLAQQLAMAVANAELHTAAQRKIADLSALHQCGRDLGPAPDLPATFTLVAERTALLLGLRRSAVFSMDAAAGELHLEAVHGDSGAHSWPLRFSPSEALTGALREPHPILTDDPVRDQLLPPAPAARPGASLFIPLRLRSEWVGLLMGDCAGEPFHLTADQMELATIFANQASVWIANARLFTAAEEARKAAQRARRDFERLLESAGDGILVVDGDGRITLANREAQRLFGYAADELLGRPVEMLLPPRLRGGHEVDRGRYLEAPQLRPMGTGRELLAARRDGTEFPVEISLSPIPTEEGTRVISIVRDITEHRKAEERFRALLEAAPDAMIVVDRSGRISLVNSQVEQLFGYTREELLGEAIEILIPERYRAAHPSRREEYHREPRLRPMGSGLELFARRKDGTEFPVEISLSPIQSEEGTSVISTIRDVTAQKEAQRALARQASDLRRSNAELEQFAYVASHDLQEPLRMVASYTQLLARRYRGKLDQDADEFIEFTVDGVKRMQELINDLLAYSRVGTHGREFAPVDCNRILERVLDNLQVAIEEREAEISVQPLPEVRGDASQLLQLFQNLVGNAIKFQKPGERPRVEVAAASEEEGWHFTVRDNGIGIEPEYAERIFLIFQRLHSRSDFPGTGIGLAICKKIVERHGGGIWVESSGSGSAFHFTIPAHPEAEAT
ncbi:MAG: PAS domain S-box protein [Armatimonadota bacterium]